MAGTLKGRLRHRSTTDGTTEVLIDRIDREKRQKVLDYLKSMDIQPGAGFEEEPLISIDVSTVDSKKVCQRLVSFMHSIGIDDVSVSSVQWDVNPPEIGEDEVDYSLVDSEDIREMAVRLERGEESEFELIVSSLPDGTQRDVKRWRSKNIFGSLGQVSERESEENRTGESSQQGSSSENGPKIQAALKALPPMVSSKKRNWWTRKLRKLATFLRSKRHSNSTQILSEDPNQKNSIVKDKSNKRNMKGLIKRFLPTGENGVEVQTQTDKITERKPKNANCNRSYHSESVVCEECCDCSGSGCTSQIVQPQFINFAGPLNPFFVNQQMMRQPYYYMPQGAPLCPRSHYAGRHAHQQVYANAYNAYGLMATQLTNTSITSESTCIVRHKPNVQRKKSLIHEKKKRPEPILNPSMTNNESTSSYYKSKLTYFKSPYSESEISRLFKRKVSERQSSKTSIAETKLSFIEKLAEIHEKIEQIASRIETKKVDAAVDCRENTKNETNIIKEDKAIECYEFFDIKPQRVQISISNLSTRLGTEVDLTKGNTVHDENNNVNTEEKRLIDKSTQDSSCDLVNNETQKCTKQQSFNNVKTQEVQRTLKNNAAIAKMIGMQSNIRIIDDHSCKRMEPRKGEYRNEKIRWEPINNFTEQVKIHTSSKKKLSQSRENLEFTKPEKHHGQERGKSPKRIKARSRNRTGEQRNIKVKDSNIIDNPDDAYGDIQLATWGSNFHVEDPPPGGSNDKKERKSSCKKRCKKICSLFKGKNTHLQEQLMQQKLDLLKMKSILTAINNEIQVKSLNDLVEFSSDENGVTLETSEDESVDENKNVIEFSITRPKSSKKSVTFRTPLIEIK